MTPDNSRQYNVPNESQLFQRYLRNFQKGCIERNRNQINGREIETRLIDRSCFNFSNSNLPSKCKPMKSFYTRKNSSQLSQFLQIRFPTILELSLKRSSREVKARGVTKGRSVVTPKTETARTHSFLFL